MSDLSVIEKFEAETEIGERQWKLSQAIREGAKLRPQCSAFPFARGGSCAWGAAYEAIFGRVWEPDDKDRKSYLAFPYQRVMALCGLDECSESSINLMTEVFRMNDGTQGHRQHSREEIADILAARGL